VAGDEQGVLALLFKEARELGAVRRLAGALQAAQHHDGGRLRGDAQLLVLAAHELRELLVDDFDDHLGGRQALEHVGAHGAVGHALGEVLDDLVADVGLEKRQPYFAHGVPDVGLGEPPLAAQLFEGGGELLG